jgi:hypothetical protein
VLSTYTIATRAILPSSLRLTTRPIRWIHLPFRAAARKNDGQVGSWNIDPLVQQAGRCDKLVRPVVKLCGRPSSAPTTPCPHARPQVHASPLLIAATWQPLARCAYRLGTSTPSSMGPLKPVEKLKTTWVVLIRDTTSQRLA